MPTNSSMPPNFSRHDCFYGIQEINENPENEEDSVILELNELLSGQKGIKEETKKENAEGGKEEARKPPLAHLKLKVKGKVVSAKTERVGMRRVASHRLIL
jgi:hypothetical protein